MYNHIEQELRPILSHNTYALEQEKVNLLITKLDSLGSQHYAEIASALRTLFPPKKLHPWVFS